MEIGPSIWARRIGLKWGVARVGPIDGDGVPRLSRLSPTPTPTPTPTPGHSLALTGSCDCQASGPAGQETGKRPEPALTQPMSSLPLIWASVGACVGVRARARGCVCVSTSCDGGAGRHLRRITPSGCCLPPLCIWKDIGMVCCPTPHQSLPLWKGTQQRRPLPLPSPPPPQTHIPRAGGRRAGWHETVLGRWLEGCAGVPGSPNREPILSFWSWGPRSRGSQG